MFVLFYERLYATRKDHELATPPTLESMLRKAAARGKTPNLSEAERLAAVDMAMGGWRAAVATASKDNARRQLKVANELWTRFDEHLHVIHARIDTDEAICAHGGDELIRRLGEQLKQQNLTPVQIFDEINRRRPADARLHVVAQVTLPVQATVHASAQAMRSIGLPDPTQTQGHAA
jgi:hypothetical protein